MNYRKFYQENTGVLIPKGYDVHHIDLNRDNNDISNLVAIPKKVHQLYHQQLRYDGIPINVNVLSNPMSYMFLIDQIQTLALCAELIHRFIVYRNSLLGVHYNFLETDYSFNVDSFLNNIK